MRELADFLRFHLEWRASLERQHSFSTVKSNSSTALQLQIAVCSPWPNLSEREGGKRAVILRERKKDGLVHAGTGKNSTTSAHGRKIKEPAAETIASHIFVFSFLSEEKGFCLRKQENRMGQKYRTRSRTRQGRSRANGRNHGKSKYGTKRLARVCGRQEGNHIDRCHQLANKTKRNQAKRL